MVPVHRPELPQPWRVSMTLPVINAARRVLMVVGDAAKAPVVPRAIAGDPELPAGRLSPQGELTWLLTRAAAAELEDRPPSRGGAEPARARSARRPARRAPRGRASRRRR